MHENGITLFHRQSKIQPMLHFIISILPIAVCLLWIITLSTQSSSNLPKRYLTVFFCISVVNYFVHATFFNNQYRLFAFMDNLWVFTSLAGYPLYYYYVRLLTCDSRIRWRIVAWILLPAILLSLYSFVIYFGMSATELDIFIHGVMYHEPGYAHPYPMMVQLQIYRLTAFKIIFIIQLVLCIYLIFRRISINLKRVKTTYSNLEGKDLRTIKWVLYALIFASSISLLSSLIGKDFFVDKNQILLIIPSLTHSFFLFFIGYAGHRQNFTVADLQQEEQGKAADTDATANKYRLGLYTAQELEHIVLKENLFINPNFRLSDLATKLNTNRTYLSRLINHELHTNFCDWINSHRIAYAKRLFSDTIYHEMPMQEIAEKCGFSSLSSFYRIFKEYEGMPPGQYRKKLSRK